MFSSVDGPNNLLMASSEESVGDSGSDPSNVILGSFGGEDLIKLA